MTNWKNRQRKCTLCFLFVWCIATISFAQQRTVTGLVTDAAGESIPGANVREQDSDNGIISDINGNFTLSVSLQANNLVVSFVGMKTKTIPLTGATHYVIVLEDNVVALNEVVAIGYGSIKKSDLTGAVGSLNGDEISRFSPTLASKALQGTVAGIQVTKSSNRPGSAFDMNIRGLNSIDYGNAPLVVIDGLVDADLDVLNPADIQSMDVLKDASATAIYGSRGANGVIIVTTRKGEKGKLKVSYDGYMGVKIPSHLPRMMNAQEFYQASVTDLTLNGGKPRSFTSTETALVESGSKGTDWIDEVTDPSLQTSHTAALSGGTDKVNYRFSVGYLNEGGNIKHTDYTRYNIKGNLDGEVTKWAKVGFSMLYSYSVNNLGSGEALRSAYRVRPTGVANYADVLNVSENKEIDWNGYAVWMGINDKQCLNPLVELDPENYKDETKRTNFSANAYLELLPLESLSLKTSLSVMKNDMRRGQYRGTYTKDQATTKKPKTSYNTGIYESYTWDNIVSYAKKINVHDIRLTAIQSAYKYVQETAGISVEELPYNSGWYNMGSAGKIGGVSSNYVQKTMLSFMGRAMYELQGKYMLTLTGRWDGASQLAEGNKWDFFPSAAIAWRIGEEEFIKNIEQISSLKFRVSYGVVGNCSVSPYSTQANLLNTTYDYGGSPAYGFAPANLANSELSWEKSRELNFGLDFGLFNSRINASLEVYNRETVDLIYQVKTPTSIGFGSAVSNVGKVSNKGVELTLNTANIVRRHFTWNTHFVFAKNKNEVKEISDEGQLADIGSNLFVGHPLGVHYYYKFDGIWQLDEAAEAAKYGQKPGSVKVVDRNGDGKISMADGEDDRFILGSTQPKWTLGITNRFTLRDFDLSFLIYVKHGHLFRNNMLSGTMGEVGSGRYNALKLDYWTVEHPTDTYYGPGITNPYRQAIQYQDASFVRVSDVTVGYNLPRKIVNKIGLGQLRFYSQVSNPFVFHDFDGMDPEFNSGTSGDDVPSMTVTFGLKCAF